MQRSGGNIFEPHPGCRLSDSCDHCRQGNVSSDYDYVSDLKNYNPEIYSDFEEKYPALTAGSSFNPFVDMNVVEFYEKVSKAVSKKLNGCAVCTRWTEYTEVCDFWANNSKS